MFGNRQFKSEDLVAYEGGYRIHPTRTFSADFAMFYNSYSNLLSAEPQAPFFKLGPVPHLTLPLVAGNKRSGDTHGTELFAEWKTMPKWKISGAYSYLKMNIHRNADSLDTTSSDPGGASPRHQFYVRSSIDLAKSLENDFTVRYVHSLDGLAVPSYYSVDAHFGYRPITKLELSLGAQNLFNDRHLEFRPDFISTWPTQVKRTIQATITWKF